MEAVRELPLSVVGMTKGAVVEGVVEEQGFAGHLALIGHWRPA